MDLREYDYITQRPDTFPRSTLIAIREALNRVGSENIQLIDMVLRDGHIMPPQEYKRHGYYKIILSHDEKTAIAIDLEESLNDAGDKKIISIKDRSYLEQYINYWNRSINEIPIEYEEYKKKQTYYDLRLISKNNFLTFLFDHEVSNLENGQKSWHQEFNMWIDYHEEHIVRLYEKIFKESRTLLDIFPREKLEQGFWAMMGRSLKCSVYNLIWESELSAELKEKLIFSVFDLYENLYAFDPLYTSCNMWWDALAFSFYEGGHRNPEHNQNDRRIQNAMFQTLKRIIELNSDACQMAALHGLGHLRHPDTKAVIEQFIVKNSGLSSDRISYANACITGDIM